MFEFISSIWRAELNDVTSVPWRVGIILGALILSACSGGGGGGPPSGEPQTQAEVEQAAPSQENFERPTDWETDPAVWAQDPEFIGQPGLSSIKAEEAYAKGVTGAGQVIGFVDTGLDTTHPEFVGKAVRLNDRSGLHDATYAQLSHGTGVASIALGARGHGDGFHGVAFDADPAFWSLFLDSRGTLSVNDEILTNAINALEGAGSRIINQSWGYATPLDLNYLDTQRRFLEFSYPDTLDAIRRGNAIHVWAAGNAGAANPSASTAWPVFFPELAGLSINVVALAENGRIGHDSNRCGDAYQHCLAAPGGVAAGANAYTNLARPGGSYRRGYGTSYAAPFVSGALALMMQAFGDQLTLQEYTGRLLTSADKSGIYASDAIYGQGKLDVQAALQPIGETGVPVPSGGLARPSESRIDGGLLPEDVLEQLNNEPVVILDELRTPFVTNLAIAPDRPQSYSVTRWLTTGQNQTGPTAHPFLARLDADEKEDAKGFWQLVPVALRKSGVQPEAPRPGSFGFAAIRTRQRGRFQFGLLGESDSFLGAVGSGAVSLGATHSAMISAAQRFDLFGDMTLFTDAHVIVSQLHGRGDSLLSNVEGAVATAFEARFNRGAFQASLSQPIYFEIGKVRLSLPHRRLQSGEVVFRDAQLSLGDGARPLALSFSYDGPYGRLGVRLDKTATTENFGFAYHFKF